MIRFEALTPEAKDLLSPQEILATKAYTIGRRGSFKDYVDLYVGLSENIATRPQDRRSKIF